MFFSKAKQFLVSKLCAPFEITFVIHVLKKTLELKDVFLTF